MLNKRHLLLALGLSGIAVISVLNVCANRWPQRGARSERKALQRWEDEGGNVASPFMAEPVKDELSQDATP